VKALRHYHDVGVLEPAEIDDSSGYRRYTAAQIAAAQLIRRLRDLDMPLDEVRTVLSAPDQTARDEAIAAHLARMELRLEETRAAVESLRALLADRRPIPGVTFRRVDAITALAVQGRVGFDDCADWLTNAYTEIESAAARSEVVVAGAAGALYPPEFFENESGDVVAYLPIVSAVPRLRGRVTQIELPPSDLAVLLHEGSFAELDRAYGALGTVVAERGIGAPGPIREHYLVSATDTDDVSRHRTEVCWPITLPWSNEATDPEGTHEPGAPR
jgi:DNA-binding transcriptional MerR regulator